MDDLVFDRTAADVTNETDKGYHDIADLNRVEEWCEYLANTLISYGYSIFIITKTDWTMTDERYEGEIERIRENIDIIKTAFYAATTTPSLPATLNPITWQKANDIEEILYDIDFLIGNMAAQWAYAGDMYSGRGF